MARREVVSCGHHRGAEELLVLWWGSGAGGSRIESEYLFFLCLLLLSQLKAVCPSWQVRLVWGSECAGCKGLAGEVAGPLTGPCP